MRSMKDTIQSKIDSKKTFTIQKYLSLKIRDFVENVQKTKYFKINSRSSVFKIIEYILDLLSRLVNKFT